MLYNVKIIKYLVIFTLYWENCRMNYENRKTYMGELYRFCNKKLALCGPTSGKYIEIFFH
jgi:hypothetical protein